MRKWILMMGLCSIVALPVSVQAATPVAAAVAEDSGTLSPTEQVKRLVDGKLTYEEASGDVRSVIDKVAAAQKASAAARLAAWLAALAAAFKLLLSAVKAVGGFTFWKERQSAVIRMVTLFLGVSVYFVSSIVGGMPWYEALFLSLSGPGSMIVHEYSKLFKKDTVA